LLDRLFTTLLDRAVARGLLPADPMTKDLRRELAPYVTPTDEDARDKAFTQPEAQRFLAISQAHSRFHDFYVVGFCTGARLGELLGLQLTDVQGRRLQVVLGHKSIKVTLDVYARYAKLMDHQAADDLGSALLGNRAGNGAVS
jgi:integrase